MPGDVFKGNAGVGLGTDLCGAMDRRSRRQCRQKTEPPCTRSVRTSGVGGQPRLITSRGHLPDSYNIQKADREKIRFLYVRKNRKGPKQKDFAGPALTRLWFYFAASASVQNRSISLRIMARLSRQKSAERTSMPTLAATSATGAEPQERSSWQ